MSAESLLSPRHVLALPCSTAGIGTLPTQAMQVYVTYEPSSLSPCISITIPVPK